MAAKIVYKIVKYSLRPWWQPKYEVRVAAAGYMFPDTAWQATCWTERGARKYVKRKASKYDYTTVEEAMMEHVDPKEWIENDAFDEAVGQDYRSEDK